MTQKYIKLGIEMLGKGVYKVPIMDDKDALISEQLLKTAPGGIAKLAFDDVVTILYATDTFYSLIKNVTDKVITMAPLALLRIVYSADIIYVTQQLAAQRHRKDNMISFNFRTLQQDGSFKWVMITGSRTNEVFQSGSKNVPVYSCIAMDVTDHMLKYKKIEQQNDYHRTITELSKELYFEYEIANDTLIFSELFHEIFGKEAIMPNFRSRLEHTKIVHPEELPAIIGIFNSVMSGRKQVRFEVRLVPKNGIPNWYICNASIIFDDNKNPYKVVGKLAITNSCKKEEDTTPIKSEWDTLTKVLTKASSEALIADAVIKQEADELSALLLLDIKNYKTLNEILKTIQGENVLTTFGGILKSHFRSTDIIGRLGTSEFVVYLKGIREDKNAYQKAELICKAVEDLHSYRYSKNGLSVSIGIAFRLGRQKDYSTLLANAHTALAMAKKVSSSSFEIYYETDI
ncbi:MAG: diguanylate cyclase/phosphodiesterase [Herbinix sp.]|jgi:diguanylate cyclase (GGDEF)-like protein|nr:diguanylate cyclase/phosphodiesterase [Herbinix sp.]